MIRKCVCAALRCRFILVYYNVSNSTLNTIALQKVNWGFIAQAAADLRLFSGHDIQELPKGPGATAVARCISQLAITSNVTDSRICSLVRPKIYWPSFTAAA